MNFQTFLLLPLLVASPLRAQDPPADEPDPLTTKTDSSYGFGYNDGHNFKKQMSRFGLQPKDLDREQFIKGFMDAFDGKEPVNGKESLNNAMLALRNQIQERERELAVVNLQQGEEFLAKNRERDGVITTDSGLQYEVLKPGNGSSYQDGEDTKFRVNYTGFLIDGTEFDASPKGSPVTLSLNVVPGFREALTTMQAGAKWKIYLKPELGYGENRRSAELAPNSVLIFEIELVEIQNAKKTAKPRAVSRPIQVPPQPVAE